LSDQRKERLEAIIRDLTKPLNNQCPRPWMTSSRSPWNVRVFTVGRNQRNSFRVDAVGSHEEYLDALFNRNGAGCRALYDRLTEKPTPTRQNVDKLVAKLAAAGVLEVLETNVICYSTPMSADLRNGEHAGGRQRGTELFRAILEMVEPSVIVAHGAGTAEDLSRVLNAPLPRVPTGPGPTARTAIGDLSIWLIPSLAPPSWNSWMRWADDHLEQVCREVADHVHLPTDKTAPIGRRLPEAS